MFIQGMQYALFQVIRDTQLSPPLFVYQPATAAGIAQVLLPPHLGGSVDDTTKPFTVDERKNGRALSTKGDVIKTPGLPPMYDWELYPGDIEFFGVKPGVMHETSHIFLRCGLLFMSRFIYVFTTNGDRAMSECDGILTANCPAFDGEPVLAAMDKWAAESGRLIFNLGPMRPLIPGTTDMPESSLDAEIAASPPGVGAKVISFLDEMLHAKGRESVVYICLGSMFWYVIYRLGLSTRGLTRLGDVGPSLTPSLCGHCSRHSLNATSPLYAFRTNMPQSESYELMNAIDPVACITLCKDTGAFSDLLRYQRDRKRPNRPLGTSANFACAQGMLAVVYSRKDYR